MVFAVNVGEALPFASVVTVAVFVPPENVPLAPVPGAVNVTVTPLVGDPFVFTVATSGFANAVLTVALCPDPLVAVIVTTGTAAFVRLKLAGAVAPVTEAVTA
jgi:hypothetical protein